MLEKKESPIPIASPGRRTRLGMVLLGLMILLDAGVGGYAGQTSDSRLRTEFHVRYVAAGAVYLDRGKNAGLEPGMVLRVLRAPAAKESDVNPTAAEPSTANAPDANAPAPEVPSAKASGANPTAPEGPVAELRVVSVALVSAVCDVISSSDEIKVGDVAVLGEADIKKATEKEELAGTRKYPQVVSFTEGNPLDEEARAFVPRPPMPSVNRARGMIGFEYGGLASGGQFPIMSTQIGGFLRADITRIGGTYWNLSGYWRGTLNAQGGSGSFQTIDELLNRTYHLQMTYVNPNSHYVAGFGRLYLPWAVSLNTIDGGYFGRKVGSKTIVGLFAGSTPDPTSWNYAPNRHLGGTFVNYSGGNFDSFRYSSTEGIGLDTIGWSAKREFVFTDNYFSYKNIISVYHALQYERPQIPGTNGTNLNGLSGLSRSFLTVRIQPQRRISFDFNDNYFRDLPTFDYALISTGLLDQLLFQGFSVGAHFDVTKNISVYNSVGKSSGTGDAQGSLNQMYGVTVNRIWKLGMRGDARWSEFNSSFGRGTYTSLSLSRNFRDTLQWQLLLGKQNVITNLSQNSSYNSVGSTLDWFPLKAPVYFNFSITREQGTIMNYDQWYIGVGYRFDNRHRAREVRK